ncbi:MAG: hypothetical protein JXM79_19150 [Sedimentisphaerales bacterium]|nr:hypothetical protein [Sedimentisphaerales bacterium]
MTSRITKTAAAAVIIIAGFLVIYKSGGSIDGTTAAFAQISENMKKMLWLHTVVEGAGNKMEVWFCFERRIMAQKLPDGRISYQDDLKPIVQVYNPDVNEITVSHGSPLQWSKLGNSALDLPKTILNLFEKAGEKVVQEMGQYKGKEARIFKMSGVLGDMNMNVEMVVDARKNVVLYLNQKVFDKDGKLTMEANGYFDYPEKGPASIYDLGIPSSVKVTRSEKEKTEYEVAFQSAIATIGNMDTWPSPRELSIAYWKARTAKDYNEMAVFWPGSATWDRQAIENEEPVEYVFGEVQETEIEGRVVVPYASKSYFDKHAKYNLKMRLSNEKSRKGRYYIVSGN